MLLDKKQRELIRQIHISERFVLCVFVLFIVILQQINTIVYPVQDNIDIII